MIRNFLLTISAKARRAGQENKSTDHFGENNVQFLICANEFLQTSASRLVIIMSV